MNEILNNFKNPPAIYRSAPFWIWNDKMNKTEIERQIRELHSHGFGGAFVHARMGLVTEYLGEEWFDCFSHALEVCRELGMKLYIYDENNWPSGNAGGIVTAKDPSFTKCHLVRKVTSAKSPEIDGELLGAWQILGEDSLGKSLLSVDRNEWNDYGENVYVVSSVAAEPTEWYGGNTDVDTCNKDAIGEYIKTTHEEYYARYKADFGGLIPAVFTDEPQQHPLLISDQLKAKFREMHGYRLEDNLPCIFDDISGNFDRAPEKVRYDYIEARHALWIENYMKQIGDWCEEHKIAFTGHLVEHTWPNTDSPATQSSYEFMHWPGTDGLGCGHLQSRAHVPMVLQAQELRSVANQFRKERVLNEMYGCGGWEVTFRQFKTVGDWWMVNGTNFMCQHLTHGSVAGYRKRDCVQSIDWRQPWWNEYTALNDYYGRTSYLLSIGEMKQRILVLNPSTTSYTIPFSKQRGHIHGAYSTDRIQNPDMKDFLEVLRCLTNEQWDYDLGDEYILERHAKVEGPAISVIHQNYDVVVISKNMKNFRSPTVKLISDFVAAGGTVICTGEAGEFIDGVRSIEIFADLRAGWKTVYSPEEVCSAVADILARRVVFNSGWIEGVEHMRREYGGGKVGYFFVNHSGGRADLNITLPGDFCAKWELYTGETHGLPVQRSEGKITFDLPMQDGQSAFIMVGDDSPVREAKNISRIEEGRLNFVYAERDWLNTMPMLYCDLELDGEIHRDLPYFDAQKLLFNKRGFEKNPWEGAIQYKTNIVDRNSDYGEGSGFSVTYKFKVKAGTRPAVLNAIIEHPDFYSFEINGNPVKWNGKSHWLDVNMGAFPIAEFIRDGVNEIKITSDRFTVLCEIEDVFLEGEFSTEDVNDEFVITSVKPISYGKWVGDNGMQFYPGSVNYSFDLEINEIPEKAVADLRRSRGSVISCRVNGQDAGIVGCDGDPEIDIAKWLKCGCNRVVFRVVGSYRNFFGPIKYVGPDPRANSCSYAQLPKDHRMKASEFEPIEYGMHETPRLTLSY